MVVIRKKELRFEAFVFKYRTIFHLKKRHNHFIESAFDYFFEFISLIYTLQKLIHSTLFYQE